MIRRTILEWESIRYGAGDEEIPDAHASRIAAVAAASPLAGRGGGGVLEHGRKALRARGVVGVIAAQGCALEILPKIDIAGVDGAEATGSIRRRLVHMLAVALDLKIDAGQVTALDWQRETLLEILIQLFSVKLVDAVRQGMPRRYIDYPDAFAYWNNISSIGAYISFASFLWFIGVVFYTLFAGQRVTQNNYWNEYADTLEWTLPSPPPEHTFEQLPKREDWDHARGH